MVFGKPAGMEVKPGTTSPRRALTLCRLIFFTLPYLLFSFPTLTIFAPRCPFDFPLSLTHNLIFNLSPHSSFFMLPPPPLLPHRFAYPNNSYSMLAQRIGPQPTEHCPLLFPKPPHSPEGEASDRALPSDYTGGAGLEQSPKGRQLSISDNCRERDTRTHMSVCEHTCRLPAFLPHLLLR